MRDLFGSAKNEELELEVFYDRDSEDPRTSFDNLGQMFCMHGRYSIGDNHQYRVSDFDGWDEFKNHIIKEYDAGVVLPIYMYDHSGITINTAGYSCPWDSGQIGFTFVSKDDLRAEYGVQRVTKKIKEKAENILRGEVELYADYLEGNVYGYILKDNDGEELDSCWGFYGNIENMKEYLPENAQELIRQVA